VDSEPLVDVLKAWRLERARADRVPAYVILHDSTIEEIARALPRTAGDLERVRGMGPTKCARYGDDILGAIKVARTAG